mmetsp:Transcript_28908/g.68520  ORF Transcript_28908/g.68520 Transcript_28908/m.68520 type:complete len:145 (-) Transcript_28908:100-534(-)
MGFCAPVETPDSLATAGKSFPSPAGQSNTAAPDSNEDAADEETDESEKPDGGSGTRVIIRAAAGAAVGVMLVACRAWKATPQCNAPTKHLTADISRWDTSSVRDMSATFLVASAFAEVVSSSVVQPVTLSETARIEALLHDQTK